MRTGPHSKETRDAISAALKNHFKSPERRRRVGRDIEAEEAYGKKYRLLHKVEMAARQRKWRYGITQAQFEELLLSQADRCAACLDILGDGPRRRNVDHDHACCPGKKSCGKCLRGVLCQGCNAALSHVKDSPKKLRQLAVYLERYAAEKTD
jgi:hypothetical protein